MPKNRKTAWCITAVIMAIGLVFGTVMTFNNKRQDGLAAFEEQIMPQIERAVVAAFNVRTVTSAYQSRPFDITAIQAAEHPVDVFRYYEQLYHDVWDVFEGMENVNMSDTNRNFLNIYHRNFVEIDLILSQAGYNRIAEEFNNARDSNSNLSIIARPFVGVLPRFDVFE